MPTNINRRSFLASTAAATAGALVAPSLGVQAATPAKEPATAPATQPPRKLRLGMIGLGGQGSWHLGVVKNIPVAQIVALCDVDTRHLVRAARVATDAEVYVDFRDLLKRKELDAVLIATPDHTHAALACAALRAGKHVYCEKPLAHAIREVRAMVDVAKQTRLVTQMGIQVHSWKNYPRAVEVVRAGIIGPVHEVHIWNNRNFETPDTTVIDPPATFNYDLWLGPLKPRPLCRGFHPYNWRAWWAFGEGLLGDIGCHLMDPVFWALDLKYPTKASAEGPTPVPEVTCAPWVIARYEFPARGPDQPAVKLTWYDPPKKPPMLAEWKLDEKLQGEGVMFIGEKGMMYTNYDVHVLLPAEKFKDAKPPAQTIPPSPGHQRQWMDACLANNPSAVAAPFSYGALLTETALLGVASYRAGKELEWDAANLKIPNAPEAEGFFDYDYRDGWTL
jgi:predicted dehydrogenase